MTNRRRRLDVRPWLAELAALVDPIDGRATAEDVHRFRVALSRLAVCAELGGERALGRRARDIRRLAAPLRDLDVVAEDLLPPRYAEWIAARRERARRALRASLDRSAIVRLVEEIAVATTGRSKPPPRWNERIARLARTETLRATIASRADATVDDLHAHRRAVRRLRFAREALGRPTARLKRLQIALGRVIDDSLRLGWVLRFPRQALVARLRVRVERRLARARRAHRAVVAGV